MVNIITSKEIIIKKKDWLLIIGLVLAPMTGLRIWKIGPAELFCFIWGFEFFFKRYICKSDTFNFFVVFLFAMCMGTLIGYIFYPNETNPSGLLVWLYLSIIAVSIYEGLKKKPLVYTEKMFILFARLSILWYVFLYLYSIYVKKIFLGAPLWYSNARYTGGANNPHQIACMVCGLFFVFLRDAFKTKKYVINVLYAMGCIYILIQTLSSTGFAAVFLGIICTVYFFFSEIYEQKKYTILIIELIIGLIFFLILYPKIFIAVNDWIESDPNGAGRISLFSSFGIAFFKSPVFGLGPGIHAWNGTKEFHNTYLEIFAATGIVGGVSFLYYSYKLVKKSFNDTLLIPIVVSMYSYGLAGFAMRRLVYWGIIVFVIVIAEKKANQSLLEDI